MHVEILQIVRQAVHLAQNGREGELDGFEQREALLEDEALEQAVQVLRVGAVARDGQPELTRLLAQLRDGVDLTVVAEDCERLHTAERGVRVGGVAVVRDDTRRRECGVGQLGIEPGQHERLSEDLVDAVVGRE